MSYAQMIEEAEYSQAARYDRFDGFDRGDLDNSDDYTSETVIARQRTTRGRLILTCYSSLQGDLYGLTLGSESLGVFDDEAQAREAARAYL